MKNPLITSVLDVLREQAGCYRDLVDLTKEKQKALVKGILEDVENITKQEQFLILRVGKLEEKRMGFHQDLANHLSILPENLTISNLMDIVDEEVQKELISLQSEVKNILAELQELNTLNAELIEQSLRYIDFSINLMADLDAPLTYPQQQNQESGAVSISKIFDRKI